MGVHISFVRSVVLDSEPRANFNADDYDRSTNLDSWQLSQLRTMKVGGNASATEFFTKHGGASLLSESDVKKKYTSRVAELYKEELAKRVKEDAIRYPTRIFVEGAVTSPTDSAKADDGDDFFSSWDKPRAATPIVLSPTTSTPPPIVGRQSSIASNGASSAPASVPSTPRAVTSSSLRSPTATSSSTAPKPNTSRLGASSILGSNTSQSTSRPAKLGAKKAAAPINFEEAERKAKEEEERIKKLGYDAKREEEEERIRKENEAAASAKSRSAVPVTIAGGPAPLVQDKGKRNSVDLERLGMGIKRLGFGQVGSTSTTTPSSKSTTGAEPKDTPTYAREKFGAQKAISSDMYFQRNAYDPSAAAEAQGRLSQFQGATSISSNQYFGREEDENDPDGVGFSTRSGNESLAGLESAARDVIGRVLSNPDVQNVGESIRSGALKV
jgi:ADP-ribosylation factor GTPase-activating protein 2/3